MYSFVYCHILSPFFANKLKVCLFNLAIKQSPRFDKIVVTYHGKRHVSLHTVIVYSSKITSKIPAKTQLNVTFHSQLNVTKKLYRDSKE